MKMLIALASGFLLWLIYGLMRGDLIIVAANAMSRDPVELQNARERRKPRDVVPLSHMLDNLRPLFGGHC